MNKKIVVTVLISLGFIVSIFAVSLLNRGESVLKRYETMSVKEIVAELERTINDPHGLSASVNGEFLVLKHGGDKLEKPMPEDEFYLSFAPYIKDTHPCAFHNLITCRGKLVKKEIYVEVTDYQGNVIFEGNRVTEENGFIGIWLPKGLDLTLRVKYNGLTATSDISTFSESETCLTTPLKLS